MYPKEPPTTDSQRAEYHNSRAESHLKWAYRMFEYWQKSAAELRLAEKRIERLEAELEDLK